MKVQLAGIHEYATQVIQERHFLKTLGDDYFSLALRTYVAAMKSDKLEEFVQQGIPMLGKNIDSSMCELYKTERLLDGEIPMLNKESKRIEYIFLETMVRQAFARELL